MDTIKVDVNIVTDTCCVCGIVFGYPDYFEKQLRKSGQTFYCPNGHSLWFGKSEADKLRDELKNVKRDAELNRQWYEAEQDDHQRTRRQLAATKGVLTKTKKRIANGVCPCCKRHFVNLERHMEMKHPNYVEGEESDSPN